MEKLAAKLAELKAVLMLLIGCAVAVSITCYYGI
jgi:hypothetical protein